LNALGGSSSAGDAKLKRGGTAEALAALVQPTDIQVTPAAGRRYESYLLPKTCKIFCLSSFESYGVDPQDAKLLFRVGICCHFEVKPDHAVCRSTRLNTSRRRARMCSSARSPPLAPISGMGLLHDKMKTSTTL